MPVTWFDPRKELPPTATKTDQCRILVAYRIGQYIVVRSGTYWGYVTGVHDEPNEENHWEIDGDDTMPSVVAWAYLPIFEDFPKAARQPARIR